MAVLVFYSLLLLLLLAGDGVMERVAGGVRQVVERVTEQAAGDEMDGEIVCSADFSDCPYFSYYFHNPRICTFRRKRLS
ncbi:hypothetical protein RQN30_08120 [Arcanobacterium hippocoleae]